MFKVPDHLNEDEARSYKKSVAKFLVTMAIAAVLGVYLLYRKAEDPVMVGAIILSVPLMYLVGKLLWKKSN